MFFNIPCDRKRLNESSFWNFWNQSMSTVDTIHLAQKFKRDPFYNYFAYKNQKNEEKRGNTVVSQICNRNYVIIIIFSYLNANGVFTSIMLVLWVVLRLFCFITDELYCKIKLLRICNNKKNVTSLLFVIQRVGNNIPVICISITRLFKKNWNYATIFYFRFFIYDPIMTIAIYEI